jgi:hypothetical protein
MTIEARHVVGAAGVLVVALMAVGFAILMPKPHTDVNAKDGTPREYTVEIREVE